MIKNLTIQKERKQSLTQQQKISNNNGYFICKCLKKYKSYAAVYTHIKNKHSLDQGYIDQIIRPSWVKAQKGRPKKFKNTNVDIQFQQMEILEMGNLQLWQKLMKSDIKNIFLQKNQENDDNLLNLEYKKLCQQFGSPTINIMNKLQTQNIKEKQYKKFYIQFCKHLCSQISVRVLWTLNYIAIYTKQNYFDIEKEQDEYFNCLDGKTQNMKQVWYNIQDIDKFISKIFRQWEQLQN